MANQTRLLPFRIASTTGTLMEGNQIEFAQLNRTVYLSQNGSNVNSGNELGKPVQTFQQAMNIIETYTANERKSILVLDHGIFNENLNINTSNLSINAILTDVNNISFSSGNVNNKIALNLANDIVIRPNNTIEINKVTGNITFITGVHDTTCIKIKELTSTGSLNFSGATGDIHIEIDRVDGDINAIINTINVNLNIGGHIGDVLFRGIKQARVPVTTDLIINSSNIDTYNRQLLYTPTSVAEEIEITISENLDIDFFDIVLLANRAARIVVQGANRINGEMDIRLTNLEAGKVIKVDTNNFVLIYDNTDPSMIDEYIDNARLNGSNLILENTNSSIADLSVDLSSLQKSVFSSVRTFSTQTGEFDLTSLGNDLIYTGTQITKITLTDTSIPTNTIFAIANEKSTSLTFDLASSGFMFQGLTPGTTTFSLPAGQVTVFYVNQSAIYEWANYNTASGSANHPIIVAKDTPSLTELNTIVQASEGDNSGFWLVSDNQVQATEDNVDVSIMIRAVASGILDADNQEIPTTAVQKRTIRLSAGTQVRVYSSTDLRVVSSPQTMVTQRYPDTPISGASPLNLVGQSALYTAYRNRTLVLSQSTGTFEVYLWSLQNAVDRAFLNYNDVFCFRNDSSNNAIFRIRTFQVGTVFSSNNSDTINVGVGQTLCLRPIEWTGGTAIWEVLEFGQSTTINVEDLAINQDWYRDETDSTAIRNSIRLHNKVEVTDGIVRDHVRSQSSTNNPISLIFQRRNIEDDIAWINWWTTINSSVPPLGTHVAEIEQNVQTALTFIGNLSQSYDFELSDPDINLAISYVTFQTNQTIKIGFDTAIANHIVVNDVITISGNSFAGNNGDWAITQIYPDRLAIDITIPSSSASNNTGASGSISRTLYCRSAVISNSIRQHNFSMYKNSARNNPLTQFHTGWFDIISESVPSNSLLQIGYNNNVQTIPPTIAIQDEAGDYYTVIGGSRGNIHYFDNSGANYQNTRYLPLNFEDLHIRTDGTCQFYIDVVPSDLPIGERFNIFITSNINNDDDDVTINIGRAGSTTNSDEGLSSLSIRNGVRQGIEIYNIGDVSGWKLITPFSRLMPSTEITSVITPSQGAIPMGIPEIIVLQNEDPNFKFMTITNNKFVLKGNFDYEMNMSIKLRFDGNEDTGLSFVNCSLVPTLTRGASTSDINLVTGNVSSNLMFVRNGNNSDDNTKPIITLNARLRHQGQVNDKIGFELRFGTFPSGYSLSDLRQISRQYSILVTGGIE